MAFTAEDFIANISSRYKQNGSHVWNYYGLARGTAWCVGEISYTFDKIGAKSKWCGGKPVFYVPTAQIWMDKNWNCIFHNVRHTGSLKNVRPGDIVVFSWNMPSRDHFGAVLKNGYSEKEIKTIEGNTSGGIVDRKTRSKKYIHSVYRPTWGSYKGKKYTGVFPVLPERGWFQRGDEGQQVKYLQMLLNWALDYNLDTDGELGPKTARAIMDFEQVYGLKIDAGFGKKCLAKAKSIKK